MTKFNEGDKVVLGRRTPKELLAQVRTNRKRTIGHIYYDDERQCRYFYLGINNRGASADIECYPFRSYMLDAVIARGPGRPRTKRKYTHRNQQVKVFVLKLEQHRQYHDTNANSALQA